MQEKKQKNQEKTAKSLSDYSKYSSLAFQMIAIILIGVVGGMKLDKWVKMSFPLFTVVLSLASVGLALYISLKDLIQSKNK
jgi:F0F1-type ATP synthase assembly protein I